MKLKIEAVAALCHAVNKAYCESIGDSSQQPWNEAPKWQRDSEIEGVKFRLKFPSAGPDRSHANWMTEKVFNGWRYGPVKDEAKKEHPCMVPFDELPQEQKAKDILFMNVVYAMVAARMIEEVS